MQKSCSLVFTGDIGFDRYMDRRYEDPELLDPRLLEYFASADHVIANVEGALYAAPAEEGRSAFFHCMDPAAAKLLQQMQADIWNLANNHIMDAGEPGLVSSLKLAARLGCSTVGAGKDLTEASAPVYLPEAGGIGILAVGYGPDCPPAGKDAPGVFSWDDRETLAARIREVKKRCRWCLLVCHGGEEFADLPNPYTRERYLNYLSLGADAVIAHHPHVPENYEITPEGKPIFYSLGNFIFDTDYQRVHPYTDRGVLLRLELTEEALSFSALGTRILRGEEKIAAGDLPEIFTDISAAEYERLSPLSARVFLEEEKAKMLYLEPERFKNADEETWKAYFFSEEPDGYVQGSHMDLSLIVPLAEKARTGAWRESPLSGVLKYLTERGKKSLEGKI